MKNYKYPTTFGRRRGKKRLSIPKYKINLEKFSFNLNTKEEIILDIGSGNGESTINLSTLNKNKIIIACEVYIDGNVSLINKIIKNDINNIRIYNKSCFLLLEKLYDKSINEAWILYPDPWPKKKHNKRRIICNLFLKMLNSVLKDMGNVYVVTDNQDYFSHILYEFKASSFFTWENDTAPYWENSFDIMPQTSYFLKAQKNCQKSYFMKFKKIP
ncbi:MAG: tRNA (guanine-N(7)-)-methyltransferase [Alphaproteobacteria bacterium MarineAlpha5_Bin11]|nr:tRNA (guanosine(46)-N7)-methyltransferase TrmB [Pelagibacteraceae bacterium]PPR45148.1 MAG: tRNA (guanine-N(7)-)-methyltransferase [Alphaproteobacteria bacterium MarineAlpha5_Bin11]PPR52120.1 MAG: tRNA (guanine-N(7)-)-methyltransferase [Alphaproteobacteria bacterium MarineAlpha5_Bin10]|tara:strand:+ start:12186 stop:12830 length:645 start_codon:yes stop_codon:yes gene_type:complete